MKTQILLLCALAFSFTGFVLPAKAGDSPFGLLYFTQAPEFIYENHAVYMNDPGAIIALTPSGEELVKSYTVQDIRFFTLHPSYPFAGKERSAGYYMADLPVIRKNYSPERLTSVTNMEVLYAEVVFEIELINGMRVITNIIQPAIMKRVGF